MKKKVRMLSILTAMIMLAALAFSSCADKAETADDGQNPAMNFIGNYVCDRASIVISASDSDTGMSAVVTWGSSYAENSEWVMSGTFDPETLQFEYHDCVRTDYVYEESGEIASQEEVYTGGHGFMTFAEGDALTLTWQDDQEHMADDMVFEFTAVSPDEGEENEVGMANPWSDVNTAAEAAEGAGLDSFSIPEGEEISLGAVNVTAFRCMDGMAEVIVEYPAVEMRIRKGLASTAVEEGDISGDYGEYKNTWTQDINGLKVTCFGNRKGESTRTIWQVDDICYSITAFGLGGDTDYGLSADDLSTLINGIR